MDGAAAFHADDFSLTACSAQISGEKAVKENVQMAKSTDSVIEREGSSEW